MTALQPTLIEAGIRSPADYLNLRRKAPPSKGVPPRKKRAISQQERARRAAIVREAIELAGNQHRLHLQVGIPASTLYRYRQGDTVVPEERLEIIQSWLGRQA